MKKNRNVISTILVFVLMICVNITVFADTTEKYVDGSLLLNMPVSEVSTNIQPKGNILDQVRYY